MAEVTEAMVRVFGECVGLCGGQIGWMLYGDEYRRQSDLWMIPVCSLLLAFGVFSTLDLYSPSSLAVEKFNNLYL
jgi:hypothetical protein